MSSEVNTTHATATNAKILHAGQSRCDAVFSHCSTLGKDLKTNRNILMYSCKKAMPAAAVAKLQIFILKINVPDLEKINYYFFNTEDKGFIISKGLIIHVT